VRADAEHEADLFWALRGGGGNYGVVTSLEFEVQAVARLYAGAMFLPLDRISEVLNTWTRQPPGRLRQPHRCRHAGADRTCATRRVSPRLTLYG
jgi:hypothetical protein